MAWLLLAIAGVLEVGWAIGMKYSAGLTRVGPTVLTLIALTASFVFLAIAVKEIPIGTGYAIWTGIGAAGTAILGMVLFGEPATPARLICLAMIVTAIIGLKLTAS